MMAKNELLPDDFTPVGVEYEALALLERISPPVSVDLGSMTRR